FAAVVRGPHVLDAHPEEPLDRMSDLDLVRITRHDERVAPPVLGIRLAHLRRALRHDRADDHFPRITHAPPPPPDPAPTPRSPACPPTARRRRTPARTASPVRPAGSETTDRPTACARP